MQTPHAGVVVLHLNRPERLNAINDVMVGELKETLAALAADTSVNAVVITGAGRGFCSGIDMRDFGPGHTRGDSSRASTGCASKRRWPHCRRRFATCRSR